MLIHLCIVWLLVSCNDSWVAATDHAACKISNMCQLTLYRKGVRTMTWGAMVGTLHETEMWPGLSSYHESHPSSPLKHQLYLPKKHDGTSATLHGAHELRETCSFTSFGYEQALWCGPGPFLLC